MRVAYFTESLYPLVDGVSRTLARLFDTLERRGVEFVVFSPFTPGKEVTWASRVWPIRYVRFPLYPDYRVSAPFLSGVRSVLEDHPVDLIHVVSPTPMAYRAQGLGRALGIPVVASFHTHFVSYFRYYGFPALERVGWALLRGFYRGCARVYAPTRSIITELEANGIDHVELWTRGIDLALFSPSRRDEDLRARIRGEPGAPVLLLVSRLVREKDLRDLVEVDRILTARGVEFRLAIVGDGPMRDELRAALPNAAFAGHQGGVQLAAWYASADVFVFPSTTETLGNVVLEALASGLPAVVVNRGGPQDLIVHGGNGYVARANDPADIADHLQRLLQDPGRRAEFARNARNSARVRDWEVINDHLLASYETVISEVEARRVRHV
jgi:phosphatidylinositol alpha 1,6-mannosyltransferase